IGSTVEAPHTTLAGYGITDGVKTSNNGSDFTSPSTVRSNLGLVIGTDVEAPHTTLAGYGITDGVKTSNNGSDFTSASTVRSNLGLVIGTDVEAPHTTLAGYGITDAQAHDTDLDCLAALTLAGMLKRIGAGTCGFAAAGTDYVSPTSGSSLLLGSS